MTIQKITFQGVLNHLATRQGTRWHMVFQASQFDVRDFGDLVEFGHLTLNLSPSATRDMQLTDTHIYFKIRKHGIVQEMYIPYTALMIIQDPDDPAASMAWPYFLDHGDDFEPSPMTGEEYAIQRMAEMGVTITPEQMAEHAAKMHAMAPDLFGADGSVNVMALAAKAQSVRKPTLQERMAERGMSVIHGDGAKVVASLPWIDEVHRAKQARRAAQAMDDKNAVVVGEEIRSDGSKGNSVFFPDLDVSKCYFPTKRIARPEWLKVIDGGKDAA